MNNKEIMLETLTHIFYIDGTKESKITEQVSIKRSVGLPSTPNFNMIHINPTDMTSQGVDKLAKEMGYAEGTILVF